LALTTDGTPAWFGYGKGVGHMILSEVFRPGGDHVGGNAETVEPVCVRGSGKGLRLETGRLEEKAPSDRLCKVCVKWSDSLEYADALRSAEETWAAESSGESVADMVMADPDAVIITLDGVRDGGTDGEPGTIMSGADVAAHDAWQAQQEAKDSKVLAEAVRAAGERARSKRTRSEGEPAPVRCVKDAPMVDVGGGKGECRSCGWRGPVKEIVTMRAEEDVEPCACPCRHKSKHGPRAKCLHRDKCEHRTVATVVMTSHWRGGRAPVKMTMSEDWRDQSLAESPATVDRGNRSADDMLGGNEAGMLPGRTSLTRGAPMDADVVTGPSERRVHKTTGESLPSSTTIDGPLGRERTDKRSIEPVIVGGRYGYLTPEQFNALPPTQRRRYQRQVSKNRDHAQHAAMLVRKRSQDERTRAERMTGV